jgi:UDPglucose--hexose-1-phosphate uridylyltransferase
MAELRKDPIVERWVIIAKNRAQRPNEFNAPPPIRSDKPCPFCAGNEALATSEIAAYRNSSAQTDWRVRVIANKYPAVASHPVHSTNASESPLFVTLDAVGAHEVIIESPQHVIGVTDLSTEQLAEVFAMYRERLLALKQDPRLRYALIFKNVGPQAGASIEHTHSQLVATPVVPAFVQEEIAGAIAYWQTHTRCVFCDLIAAEQANRQRIVLESHDLVAFCPFAARFPMETWIFPRRHASHFELCEPSSLAELAEMLRSVVAKIERSLDNPSYNYILHTAPFDTHDLSHYHWHIEIIPRTTSTAGFEWGAGYFINPVPPEEAAALLRHC